MADEGTVDDGTVSHGELLAEAVDALRAAGCRSPLVPARRIAERATGREGGEWVLALDQRATRRVVAHFDDMLARRLAGEPLQYVVGSWGFRTLDLMVDRRVMIPRPETEQVVEHALVEVDRVNRRPATVVDLGTGTGAIALSVAAERTEVEVWGVDRSPDALAVARANLAGVGGWAATRVRLVEGYWFDALPGALRGGVDVVVANPPYVAADEELPVEVREWEPIDALVPGPTGLEAIADILDEAATWLAPGGVLVCEIGATQGSAAAELARAAAFALVEVRPDLTGRDRVLVAGQATPRESLSAALR